MKKEINFTAYAIHKNIKDNSELRASFWITILGMMVNNIAFLVVWLFFVQTAGSIGGWNQADIFGAQGFVALVFGVLYSVGSGLQEMSQIVSSGRFDQFLVSPKNLLIRIATSSFSTSAVGDILFGVICIGIYLVMISATPLQVGLTILLSVTALLAFTGVTIAIQSINFFFTNPETVTRGVFDLFFSPSMFHGGAFQGATRFIFTFLVPSLLIGTLPIEAIRQVSYAKIALLIALSVFWFVLSLWIFKKAVRRYESSNFMTFGS